MNRLLIDTCAYTAFLRGVPQVVDVMSLARDLVFCPIVLGELLAGFKGGTAERKNRAELEAFLDNERVRVITIDAETPEFYTEVFRALRQRGKPIPTNDIWIAACALQGGLAVCTLDRHFNSIDGLIVVDPR